MNAGDAIRGGLPDANKAIRLSSNDRFAARKHSKSEVDLRHSIQSLRNDTPNAITSEVQRRSTTLDSMPVEVIGKTSRSFQVSSADLFQNLSCHIYSSSRGRMTGIRGMRT